MAEPITPLGDDLAAMPPECEHHYASIHEPGHRLYWVRQCTLCHRPDWRDLDAQVDELVAEHPGIASEGGDVTENAIILGRYPVSPEDCVAHGGHCFESTNYVLDSMPPQYPEVCKHCGKWRIGTPQPSMSYRYE